MFRQHTQNFQLGLRFNAIGSAKAIAAAANRHKQPLIEPNVAFSLS
jgi:hypothetical protein